MESVCQIGPSVRPISSLFDFENREVGMLRLKYPEFFQLLEIFMFEISTIVQPAPL